MIMIVGMTVFPRPRDAAIVQSIKADKMCIRDRGMITGIMSGLVFRKLSVKKVKVLFAAVLITVPGTIVSSVINAVLFGGVTSSGSSILVQLLSRTPLGLTGSIFAVQFLTDYLDRCISVFAVSVFVTMLGGELRQRLTGNVHNRAM